MSCLVHPGASRDPVLLRCMSCPKKRMGYPDRMEPESRSSDDPNRRQWELTPWSLRDRICHYWQPVLWALVWGVLIGAVIPWDRV